MGNLQGIFLVASLVSGLAASSFAAPPIPNHNGASTHAVIKFHRGEDALTVEAKTTLKKLVEAAQKAGPIDAMEVAVWSDQPLPPGEEDLSPEDRNLADNRSDQIEGYLKSNLHVSFVKTFNMAEGSNWLSRTLNTNAEELVSVFSREEAPLMTRKDFDLVKKFGGAQKAVVLVERNAVAPPVTNF